MTRQTNPAPSIQWDGSEWSVSLPIQDGKLLKANWKPGLTYVARVREAGVEQWSFGFESPLTHFSFVDLKADTEYEVQVRPKNAAGEGKPQLMCIRTNPAGNTDNIIPFPRP